MHDAYIHDIGTALGDTIERNDSTTLGQPEADCHSARFCECYCTQLHLHQWRKWKAGFGLLPGKDFQQ